ncbi:MAG: hypothetical protein Q4C82_10320 [Eubacteriales bacterium]|nr:hypothetical protein [Eubacteriales bacterium]
MKKKLLGIVAVIFVFGVLFAGLTVWKYMDSQQAFAADGYILTDNNGDGTVASRYFSAGTAYRSSYGNAIVYEDATGAQTSVDEERFVHYNDGSISAFSGGMIADLDEAESGVLDFYYLAPKMVLTSGGSSYTIDNNGTQLSFANFIYLLEEDRFLVQACGGMTLTLANGTTEEVSNGYLEIDYPDDNIVQVSREDAVWQSVSAGCYITLSNGVTINLGDRTVYDSQGNGRFTINDVAMDLASGSGIAVQSDSDTSWVPPTFEFAVVDGADGTDGNSGQAGESGEEGTAGTAGNAGEDGETGDAGRAGAAGGSSGTSGSGGSGGAGDVESALGRVIISSFDYDCYTLHASFYAEDTGTGTLQDVCRVEIVEVSSGRVVRTLEPGRDGWVGDSTVNSSVDNPVEITAEGLNPDTEYQLLIYNGYSVSVGNGQQNSGTKVFASRKFYTASEGVSMEVTALSETGMTLNLEKKSYSNAVTARVKVTFEGRDENGNSQTFDWWSGIVNLNPGANRVEMSVIDDESGESHVGLTSNIPYTVTLYTSQETNEQNWAIEADQDTNNWVYDAGENGDLSMEPEGLETSPATVLRSGQRLEGTTLKAAPSAGEIKYDLSGNGYYLIYLNNVVDPDNSVINYRYTISSADGEVLRTITTTSSEGIELYVDEEVIKYGEEYRVTCTVTYNDNEKDYTLEIAGALSTGSGVAVVTFEPADATKGVPGLPEYVQNTQMGAGYTWLYGCLVIDVKEAGFAVNTSKQIEVTMTSGGDYLRTLTYDSARMGTSTTVETPTYDYASGTYDYIYNTTNQKLYLPVNVNGLKDGSTYAFQVSAYVTYSEQTSAYRKVGTAVCATKEYGQSLRFNIEDLSDDDTGMRFGISLEYDGEKDPYPMELLSGKALEVEAYNEDNIPIDTFVLDLYDDNSYSKEQAASAWYDETWSPMARFLETDFGTEVEAPDGNAQRVLCTLDQNRFGDISSYKSIGIRVTKVYDYTRKGDVSYRDDEDCNVSDYSNEIGAECEISWHDIGSGAAPALPERYEGAATWSPIVNSTSQQGNQVAITSAGGTVDRSLDSETIRGYRVTPQYTSSSIDTVTYYLIKYDDWAEFNYSLSNGLHGATTYVDIVNAKIQYESGADVSGDAGYWADKVLAMELDFKAFGYTGTTAPSLDILYTEDQDLISEGVQESETGGFVCYTDQIKRGQTYYVAYTVLDGYTTDTDGNANYLYPYANSSYPTNNTNILRTEPLRMDRQAPRVKLSLSYTDATGAEHWSFQAYDPDQALGKMTVGTDSAGSYGINQLEPWSADLSQESNLQDGYIMSSAYTSYSSNALSGNLAEYVASGWTTVGTSVSFPEVARLSIDPMTAGEISASFSYSVTDPDGKAWKGSFAVDMTSEDTAGVQYLFLGRSLNDSRYLTNQTASSATQSPGLGMNHPTLYAMAAAQRYHELYYSADSLGTELAFTASLTSNNLNFSVQGGTDEVKKQIAALEVTVYQGTEDGSEYEELDSKVVAFSASSTSAYAASLELSNIEDYRAGRLAYATVRLIYDTGLYGAEQPVYMEQTPGMGTYDIWKNAGSKVLYSVREQGSARWYTSASSTSSSSGRSLSGPSTEASGSVWDYTGTITDYWDQSADQAVTLRKENYTGNISYLPEANFTLTAQSALGDERLTDQTYLSAAVGGWNDTKNTRTNLVFGVYAKADGGFRPGSGSGGAYGVTVVDKATEITVDGEALTLAPNQAVSFLMPNAEMSTADNTTIETYYNKTAFTFGLSADTKRRLSEAESSYLPYVFAEVYRGTTWQQTINNNGYYMENEGTLVDELVYDDELYVTGPKSYYNAMYRAAEGDAVTYGAALSGLAAIPERNFKQPTTGQQSSYRTTIQISNLTAGAETENYSLRLYVLPKRDEDGNPIKYDDFNTVKQHRQYLMDNAAGTSPNHSRTGFYYYDSPKAVWWKLRTASAPTIGSVSAVYEAESYTEKTLSVNLYSSGSSPLYERDAYLEFRLLDSSNNVVLDNEDMMTALKLLSKKAVDFSYYDQNGELKSDNPYTGYARSDSAAVSNMYGNETFEFNLSEFINNGKLTAGATYTVQARICMKDPTLAAPTGPNGTLFTTSDVKWAEDATGVTREAVVSQNSSHQNGTTIQITRGGSAQINASANYEKRGTQDDGYDMSINASVTDSAYRLGLWNGGTLTQGSYRIRIYQNSENGPILVSDQFRSGNRPVSNMTFQTGGNAMNTLVYENNQNYDASYYLEVWGTYDGTKHQTIGCPCRESHGPDDVDSEGNICVITTRENTVLTDRLTMPDTEGVRIQRIRLTYNQSTGTLSIQAEGVGYTEFREASVSLSTTSKSYSATEANLQWTGNTCTVTFTNRPTDIAGATWDYSIQFRTSTGREYQSVGTADF